ncbi:hypothetical protein L3X38_002447 [Prunus dulcis]|uniref:Uncharacterized protein n=1 Tax=Prunus dulcis TaxID=3755 RepID=A0AAD4WU00_PRUDU|nr:hypothetical protein L3X38_002447 [Prunus dulcis]
MNYFVFLHIYNFDTCTNLKNPGKRTKFSTPINSVLKFRGYPPPISHSSSSTSSSSSFFSTTATIFQFQCCSNALSLHRSEPGQALVGVQTLLQR